MATQLAPKHTFGSPSIPDRLYFKIGDVAHLCKVETYVLRFWETQFSQLKPCKSGTGQRLYRRCDVETALEIKRLVHDEGYTLSGARQALEAAHNHQTQAAPQDEPQDVLQARLPLLARDSVRNLDAVATVAHVLAELREIASLLASPTPCLPQRRTRLATLPTSAETETLFPS